MSLSIQKSDLCLKKKVKKLTNGSNEIILGLRYGKCIRFNEQKVRPMGRTASGVKGVTLGGADDEVVGMICLENDNQNILVVSEKGFGKKSELEDYRITNRGGKGVKTINVTDKTGKLVAIKAVTDEVDLMIITKSGTTIRLAVSDLRTLGRATQGVKLINIRDGDEIASVTSVAAGSKEFQSDDEEDSLE